MTYKEKYVKLVEKIKEFQSYAAQESEIPMMNEETGIYFRSGEVFAYGLLLNEIKAMEAEDEE